MMITNSGIISPQSPLASVEQSSIFGENDMKTEDLDAFQKQSVSVIIPLYNHERFIGEALESAIEQTVRPLEIIVVDDGSSDNSAKIAKSFADRYHEVNFWSQENRGAHDTLNAAIYRARGDIVGILNSDDVYHSDRLAEGLAAFCSEPTVDVVFTGINCINDQGENCHNPWYEQAVNFYKEIGDLSLALVNGNFLLTTSNLMVRRNLFQKIGYFSNLRYTHDLDLFLRLTLHNIEVRILDRALLDYRIHENNTIAENHSKVKIEWAAVAAYFFWARGQRRPSASSDDWGFYSRLIEITDRHSLTSLLLAFIAFFQSQSPVELTVDSYRRDDAFCNLIQELVH
jgi:glycosyltransferase involved in cell wall biosynthesis